MPCRYRQPVKTVVWVPNGIWGYATGILKVKKLTHRSNKAERRWQFLFVVPKSTANIPSKYLTFFFFREKFTVLFLISGHWNKIVDWTLFPSIFDVSNLKSSNPFEFGGSFQGNLISKRGVITDTSQHSGMQVIDGTIPLAETFGYSSEVRGLTAGRGSFSMEPAAYEKVPKQVCDKILLTFSWQKDFFW